MKVEHITYNGNTLIRDTTDINLNTVNHFRSLQLKEANQKIVSIDKLSFDFRVTIADGLAMFDIMKGSDLAFVNVCCFDRIDKEAAMLYVNDIAANMKGKAPGPILNTFLYTLPVNPLILDVSEAMIAGEVELYVYYSIFLGLKK